MTFGNISNYDLRRLRAQRIKRREGSALVIVLALTTFITTVIGVLLLAFRWQIGAIQNEVDAAQALCLAEAAVHKALWRLSGNGGFDHHWRAQKETIELFGEKNAQVSIDRWGAFLRIFVEVEHKKQRRVVQTLVGQKPPTELRTAVHVTRSSYPLVLVGKTRLSGDVLAGKQGVKPGWIKGRGFAGETLVNGRVLRQEKPAPPFLDAAPVRELVEKYQNRLSHHAGTQIFESVSFSDSLSADSLFVHGDLTLTMNEKSFVPTQNFIAASGNVSIGGETRLGEFSEIVCGGRAIVRGYVRLQNVIIYAEKGVEISGSAVVSGQIFSPVDIVISERAELRYPSLIWRFKNETDGGEVVVTGQAVVRGTVIAHSIASSEQSSKSKLDIRIDKNARLLGRAIASGAVVPVGEIIGGVTTNEFTLYVRPTTYHNYLLDAVIDYKKLPQEFLLPVVFSESPKLDVISWRMTK